MATDLILSATSTVTEPMAVGIGIAGLILLYLGFKAAKFLMKLLLLLVALTVLGLAAWAYYATRHGNF